MGIDASNARAGGGFKHLVELLKNADPTAWGVDKVVVWCNRQMFAALPDRPWLEKINIPALDRNIFWRLFWQHFRLPHALSEKHCSALLSTGGLSPFFQVPIPTIVMSANMLPFEKQEYRRYPLFSYARLRLKLLRMGMSRSFSRADLMIFLAPYAKNVITPLLKNPPKKTAIIPHGIEPRFFTNPEDPKTPVKSDEISRSRPFRFLYVSSIDVYKHQWHVAEAAKILRDEGFHLRVDFLGSTYSYPLSLKKFRETKTRLDPQGEFLYEHSPLPFEQLPSVYQRADGFVYASSCENLPNILIEAMASGLPIASSDRGPMPEVLGEAGLYFNPESAEEIATKMRELILHPELRNQLSHRAVERARKYSWSSCAQETFSLIGELLHSVPPGSKHP